MASESSTKVVKKTKAPPQEMRGQFGRVMRSGAEGEICRFLSTPDALRFARCSQGLLPAISGVLDVFDIGLDVQRPFNHGRDSEAASAALQTVVARSPRITSLVLSHRIWVSGETIMGLLASCNFERLESLGLRKCTRLSFQYIRDHIMGRCPRLRTLDLSAMALPLAPWDIQRIGGWPSVRTICFNFMTLHRSYNLATVLEGFACVELYDPKWHPGLKFRRGADNGPMRCRSCRSVNVSLDSRGSEFSHFQCHECGVYFRQSSLFDPPSDDEEKIGEEILDLDILISYLMSPDLRKYPRIIATVREAAPDLELAFRNDFERWTCPPAELDARVLELREAWGDMHSDEESVEVDEDDDEDLYEWEPEPIIPGEGGNEYGDY
jgi:hypothetical protein